ncbi:glutathione peroxidase 2-like [Rhopilema esculentum]|uniref:glutathione peroxidase 2-like n=1 Tax=Rhopilema esculentum TaxID=499914 RepID=UPI0031D47425
MAREGRVDGLLGLLSLCGYTPQYRALNALKSELGALDATAENSSKCYLDVVAFPCNQFGYQEPSENFELLNTLKHVRPGYGFVPNFPLTGKLLVNGQSESPIFTFLKARCPSPFGLIANRSDITWTPIRNNDVSWNFSKWLIDHNGQPFRRYTPRTEPRLIQEDIKELLRACEEEKQGVVKQQQQQQQQNATAPANATETRNLQGKPRARRTLIHN